MVWAFCYGSVHTVSALFPSRGTDLVASLTWPRRALANKNEPLLRVYSTGDGPDVYEDAFLKIAKPDGEDFHPTLILVGTRLGIDKITPVYWEAVIASLQMRQSVGIAGWVALQPDDVVKLS
jgi:Peptidase family C54